MSISNPKNNTELVQNLMDFSPHGALSQVFVIEAIQRYAKQCAESEAATMDTGMISGEVWKAVAVDIKTRVEAFYKR